MFTRTLKPWGFEDRMEFHNSIAIVHLFIKPGFSTSMHSHPIKTTSMLCLKGNGVLKFINSEDMILPNDGFTIRSGLFHCISNTSNSDILEMLEFESPIGVDSLCRLYDSNGRRDSSYGTQIPLEDSHLLDFFTNAINCENIIYSNLRLALCDFSQLELSTSTENCAFVILKGGLWDVKTGQRVLSAPEYIKGTAITKLFERFDVVYDSLLLQIKAVD